MITYIAYANGSKNNLGPADAGITIYRKAVEGSQVMEEKEVLTWIGSEIDDEDGELDTAAAKQLGYLGWEVTGAGWSAANDGQWVIEVEPSAGAIEREGGK